MKKTIPLAIFLSLAAVLFGATAALTSPKANESWPTGTDREIAWTWSGSATVRLLLFKQSSGALGIIKNKFPLGDGRCSWTVGVLKNGAPVPSGSDYSIRLVDTAGDVLIAKSPVFSINADSGSPFKMLTMTATIIPPAGKAIQVGKPGKNAVWIPLKTYQVKWSWELSLNDQNRIKPAPASNCAGFRVDVWLMPAGGTPGQKIPLASQICTGYVLAKGIASYAGAYEGIVPNAASGSYFVRVALSHDASFYGDSPAFAVQSTLSSNTGFVGPDPGQGQADLALQNVFLDSDGNIMMKIRNMGEYYQGSIRFSGQTATMGGAPKPFEFEDTFTFQTHEVRDVRLMELGGFRFEDGPLHKGNFIPLNTKPISVSVTIHPNGDINPSNNAIYNKELCRLPAADIGTDGDIQIVFGPQKNIYLHRGTANSIHESQVKWIGASTFEADVATRISNFGCKPRTFDVWLYADKLPGQLIFGGASLQPGMWMDFKQRVQVKLASRCGAHSLVLIVDPQEHDNQPYPDSYMNNFINATLNILCGGSVQGGG